MNVYNYLLYIYIYIYIYIHASVYKISTLLLVLICLLRRTMKSEIRAEYKYKKPKIANCNSFVDRFI